MSNDDYLAALQQAKSEHDEALAPAEAELSSARAVAAKTLRSGISAVEASDDPYAVAKPLIDEYEGACRDAQTAYNEVAAPIKAAFELKVAAARDLIDLAPPA